VDRAGRKGEWSESLGVDVVPATGGWAGAAAARPTSSLSSTCARPIRFSKAAAGSAPGWE